MSTMTTVAAEYPTSAQQRRMLEFIGDGTDVYYVMVEAFVLSGEVDVRALRAALKNVVDRHDVLRAVYPPGRAVYRIAGGADDLIARMWTEASSSYATTDVAVNAGFEAITQPMDLSQEPPLRVWVARQSPDTTVVVVAGHHVVFDAWTFMLFYEDWAAEYQALDSGRRPRRLPAQYADAQPVVDAPPLDAWAALLNRPYRAVRSLSAAASAPKGPGVVHRRTWPGLTAAVEAAAKRFSVTPFVIGSAAMLRGVAEVFGDTGAIFGSAYAGRTSAAATSALGYYSTSLFVGADLAAHDTADGLVRHLHDELRRWHNAPRIQWEDLLDHHDARDVYAVKFAFQPVDLAERKLLLPGVETAKFHREKNNLTARRPVDLIGTYDRSDVTASMIVRTDVMSERDAERLIGRFGEQLTELAG